jgi:hypothetical protein
LSAHDHAVNPATSIPAQARTRVAPAFPKEGGAPMRPTIKDISAGSIQRWQFKTLADAFEPRKPVEYLVEGLIAAGSLAVVYGAPGTYKTMLLIDMLIAVATGTHWLQPMPNTGGRAKKTIAAPTMLIDFDSGDRRSAERIEALAKSRRLAPDSKTKIFYVSMPSPWLIASQRDGVLQLAEDIKTHGVRLVVIDNLGVITGGIDENSSEMVSVMSNLRWLTETTGSAIVLIHHERKSTGEARKGGDALRGHSSINAALDLALLVEREGGSRIVTLRSTKTRDVDVEPFGAEFNFNHRAGTTELETAYFWGVGDSVDDESDRAVEAAVLDACFNAGKTGLNGSRLVSAVQENLHAVGAKRIRAIAKSLVTRKRLAIAHGQNNSDIYTHV